MTLMTYSLINLSAKSTRKDFKSTALRLAFAEGDKATFVLIINCGILLLKVHVSASAPRGRIRDEGRPLGAGLQEQASNHLKLLW